MTTTETAEDIKLRIAAIRSAAFGMNVPVNAGQQAIIERLEAKLAEMDEEG